MHWWSYARRWMLRSRRPGTSPEVGLEADTDTLLGHIATRWDIEITHQESRAYLGVEIQRRWSDLAIERSTSCLFGLYNMVVLLGHVLHLDGVIPVQRSAWYAKPQTTFSDVLATVRQHCWGGLTFQT